MSQNDFNIANQGFAAFRGDLNGALQALATNSSGATGPSTTYAYQWWYDTTANILRIRNAANSAWINFASFDQGAGTWSISGDLTIADKIVHSGDTNTAIRFPADDTVTVETNGAERMRVTSAGNVGIGTTSPSHVLDVRSNTTGNLLNLRSDGTGGNAAGLAITAEPDLIRINTTTNLDALAFGTGSTSAERMRINAEGKILASAGTNWVGTVSQSGQSSVIERGSNANGEFVKYADGTLICTKILSVTTGVTTLSAGIYIAQVADSDWASTFSATPSISRQIISSAVNLLWVGSLTSGGQPSTTKVGGFYLVSNASRASGAIDIHMTGTGRWF
jgi:hypothetical protein